MTKYQKAIVLKDLFGKLVDKIDCNFTKKEIAMELDRMMFIYRKRFHSARKQTKLVFDRFIILSFIDESGFEDLVDLVEQYHFSMPPTRLVMIDIVR